MPPSLNTNASLINQLEQEAKKDLASIDKLADEEAKLSFADIKEWYFETEKLIRVLANVLPSTMTQPINQLRYAGHHVLKAVQTELSPEIKQTNIIEAWKHCKRAYYDAIDLYAFHMEAAYREKIAVLPDKPLAKKLASKLLIHLQNLQEARFKAESRIAYYSQVHTGLLDGLRIINEINEALHTAGITEAVIKSRLTLLNENTKLSTQLKKLESQATRRIDWWMRIITVSVILATLIGLLFQSAGTQWLNLTAKPTLEIHQPSEIILPELKPSPDSNSASKVE